jgi:hypothetical protein
MPIFGTVTLFNTAVPEIAVVLLDSSQPERVIPNVAVPVIALEPVTLKLLLVVLKLNAILLIVAAAFVDNVVVAD